MFKGSFFLLLVFLIRASFSKDDRKPVSKKINIHYIKLVSMCSLGTVLWLTLVPAVQLSSFNGVTVEIDHCDTCHIFALPSFAGQTQAFQFLHCCLSYCSFSELKSDSKVSALNQKSMQFLDNKSDSFHSGRVLKL